MRSIARLVLHASLATAPEAQFTIQGGHLDLSVTAFADGLSVPLGMAALLDGSVLAVS